MSPDHHHAQLRRGRQLLLLSRWPEAEACFRGALASDPDDADLLFLLAVSLQHQPGKRRAALDAVDRAIAVNPEDADCYVLRSEILFGLDRFAESLAGARQATGIDPDNVDAWCRQAMVFLRFDRRAEAEQAARTAMSLDSDHAGARMVMGMALDAGVRTAENLELLRGSLRDDPEDSDAHTAMGRALLQRGEATAAEEHFAEALRLEPGDLFARNGLLEALRARSFFYRWYLRAYFVIERVRRRLPGSRILTFFGLGHILGGILHGTATFLLLFSSRVRPLLLPSEKLDAILTGPAALTTVGAAVAALCGAGDIAWKISLLAGFLTTFASLQNASELPDRLRSDVTTWRRR